MPTPFRRETPSLPRSTTIAFDKFEVDARSGELRRNSSRIRLQAQPFQLLLLLLRNAGEVVTREEICSELWPADTFVDFEHSLAAAVNKVRDALGDSAESPKFIETLPKRGYRFIGTIKPDPPVVMPSPEISQPAELSLAQSLQPGFRLRRLAALIVLAVIALATTTFWLFRTNRSSEPLSVAPLQVVPFTSYQGSQTAPALSPDGSRIVFAWDNRKNPSGPPAYDLYLKAIGSETLLRLTNHPSEWISSAWSPDGTQIAFHRLAGADNAIYLIPVLGGPERKLHDTHTPYNVAAPISWSPDGKWLAYADAKNGQPGDRNFLLNLETLEAHEFPHDASCNHEALLTFSHDPQRLAILCVHTMNSFEYSVTDPAGKSRRSLATVSYTPSSLAWSGDDKSLIISSQSEENALSQIRVSDGSLHGMPVSSAGVWPAISSDGKKLAFASLVIRINIWRRDLLHPAEPPVQAYTSTLQQNEPAYSPDGRHVAFDSARSGIWSVWMADVDGSNLVQVSHDRLAGFPHWSPDSQKIAFVAEDEKGVWSAYVASVADLVPRKLKTNISLITAPSWSHDGKWIYFRAYQAVGHQLYRCPADGGDATQLAASQDFNIPQESADGKTLYFTSREMHTSLMSLSLDRLGASPQAVPGMPQVLSDTQWTVSPNGIYFVPRFTPRSVAFYDFATQRTRELFRTDRDLDDGLAVSPDGRYILYSQADENTSNIMLVPNFH
jgi:Tol biopolymer transport system component/DNA-binding winged helix-turn-helix (wHTH) protein